MRSSGPERPLVLEVGGRFLDLSAFLARGRLCCGVVDLLRSGWLEREALAAALGDAGWRDAPGFDPARAPLDLPLERDRVGKVLALGKNVRAHAEEFGEGVPEELLFFAKLPETLVPHGAEVEVPGWVEGRFDHEAELAVVLGREGRDLAPDEAMACVGGYSVANDLTARTLQGRDRRRGHPWTRAKNVPAAFPLGPCLVPRDFLDPHDVEIVCRVNGEERQRASTRDLEVDVPHALSFLSHVMPLHPGDVVLMGTPAGVGPLADGDVVECEVTGIGVLSTRIVRRSD